jgi:HK97 family phage major capsid protein
MPQNNIISRGDAQALMPEEVSNELLRTVVSQSATLSRFRRIPVGRQQVRLPVLSALPTAYFVAGDTGMKQTTELAWANKFLNIEEIAVIVPIPDNVIADMEANIWDEAMPLLTQAFGRCLDNAVFFGVGAPASYPASIAAAVAAAGNMVTEGDAAAAGAYFGDIDNLLEKVEADGYEVNGWVAATSLKSQLRKSRNTLGDRLDQSRTNGALNELDGYGISYPMRGMFPTGSGSVRVFGGDFDQFVVGVRQDISMKVSNEAVIQDSAGNIVYNSFQQDLTFLRLTFRVGWQVANTINYDNPDESTRYPVGGLALA